MEKIDKLITSVQELLERMKTRSRDADKYDYRNSLSVSGGCKFNSETKRGYWASHEMNISMTTRFDDDEPNKSQDVDTLKRHIAEHTRTFEEWYNKRYNCGATPVKRSQSTKF